MWLRGQFLVADSQSDNHFLILGLLWQQLKLQINKTYILDVPYIDSIILHQSMLYKILSNLIASLLLYYQLILHFFTFYGAFKLLILHGFTFHGGFD